MSTGVKVDNGALAMTPDGETPRTAMEAAKAAGKRIGLITTAGIYGASPAGFSVHAKSRTEAQAIVDQYLAMEPDVLIGGGTRCAGSDFQSRHSVHEETLCRRRAALLFRGALDQLQRGKAREGP
jgi:alkaline phosphatase